MKNISIFILSVSISLTILSACSSTPAVTPVAVPIVVGTWNLNKVILTELPLPYSTLNGTTLDPLQYFGVQSNFILSTNKTFTNKEVKAGIVTNNTGSWVFSNNQLLLTFANAKQRAFTYNAVTKLLNTIPIASTETLTHPTKKVSEKINCKIQHNYLK